MNKKGFSKIIFIIIFFIVFGALAGGYFYFFKPEEKNSLQETKTSVSLVAPKQDSYRNTKFSYQFNIPNNWRVANLFTSFVEANWIITVKYENKYPEIQDNNFTEKAKQYEDSHAIERRDLMQSWRPEGSEWVVLSNLSENQESQFYESMFRGEKNLLEFPAEDTITIQAMNSPAIPSDFKEIDNERNTRKKITLSNGQIASYRQLRTLGVTLVSIPLKEQSNKVLINGKAAKSLLIEFKGAGLSQEQFLEFINAIQTF